MFSFSQNSQEELFLLCFIQQKENIYTEEKEKDLSGPWPVHLSNILFQITPVGSRGWELPQGLPRDDQGWDWRLGHRQSTSEGLVQD